MNEEKKLLIKSLYESGETILSIKEKAKCSNDSINKVIIEFNLAKRGRNRKTEKLDEQKVCELYKNGTKVHDIITLCRCSTNTISKVLDKYNIPKRAKPRKVNKDLSKFKDLDNLETQYWLGYICADGNIEYNKDSGIYKVSLFSKDKEIIDKYSEYFGECVNITQRPSGLYEAYICSKELCQYFINMLNIVPNKSLILNPNINYTSNFILGYFDGDGCIRNSNEKQTRYECNITCGSKVFIDNIYKILQENGIYCIIYKHSDCNAYKIRIDRKLDSEKFYHFLYKNAVTCLSRKLNNFVALYGNIKNTLGELQGNIGKSAAKQED